jgi:hypothetical protein
MAIKKSVAVGEILKRAEARLDEKPQPWAAQIVASGRKASSLLEGLEAIAAKRNPTETPEAHAIRVNRAAAKVAEQIEALHHKAEETRTAAARSLADQIQIRSQLQDGPRGAEIRALFRQLSGDERQALMKAAIENKDAETLGALLTAPAYLSGLGAEYQSHMKYHYERQVAPELHEALDEVLAADEAVAVVRRVVREVTKDAMQPDYIDRILKDQAEAERAQAGFDEAMRA